MKTRVATCACGQLSVTCSGEPSISLCNCRQCQKRTGSAFGLAAFFPRYSVSISGISSAYRRRAESGFDVEFHFCATCGSTVFWYPERKLDAVAVAVGCFANPDFPGPEKSVYEETRHPWWRFST